MTRIARILAPNEFPASPLHQLLAEEDTNYRWLALMHRRGLPACRRAYAAYARSCLEESDDVLSAVYGRSVYAIGDDDHIQEVEGGAKRPTTDGISGKDLLLPPSSFPEPAAALAAACAACGIPLESVRWHGRKAGMAKTMVIELACRMSGRSQREMGAALGLSEHAIGKQRSRLAEKMKEDPSVANQLEQLLRRLSIS